jgi:DNA-directed RNA polymerase specialized sigma24 family protein
MRGLDPHRAFDELLSAFSASCEELDRAILQHSIDEWPMGKLAKQYGTTPAALHSREKELLARLREYLLARGISRSEDIIDQ